MLLEVHAEAEKRSFYPSRRRSEGLQDRRRPDNEVGDAIKDHNEIRDAVRETARHEVGLEWWAAIWRCAGGEDDHMGEEEGDDLLLDFRHTANLQTPATTSPAAQYLQFEAQHASGHSGGE